MIPKENKIKSLKTLYTATTQSQSSAVVKATLVHFVNLRILTWIFFHLTITSNNYCKWYKILNPFLFLFSDKIRTGIHNMLIRIANLVAPLMISVCHFCLGLLGRQLVFEILEQFFQMHTDTYTRIQVIAADGYLIQYH